MIYFILLMIFSSSLFAATSLEQTITLNAKIVDSFVTSEQLSTSIVGPSFQPIIYNKIGETFDPIFYRLISVSSKSVEQFSFNVHYKDMTCSTVETNKTMNIPPDLSIEPGDVREINNKITLSGGKYWNIVEFNGGNQYISDLTFKISFPKIPQLQQESMYCVGTIVLLSTIDI